MMQDIPLSGAARLLLRYLSGDWL